MSDNETLERAITKAIDNGWQPLKEGGTDYEVTEVADIKYYFGDDHGGYGSNDIIWRHDFAKALWGQELHHETFIVPKELSSRFAGTTELSIKPLWQQRLQQMVIADDPIKYLGYNL